MTDPLKGAPIPEHLQDAFNVDHSYDINEIYRRLNVLYVRIDEIENHLESIDRFYRWSEE